MKLQLPMVAWLFLVMACSGADPVGPREPDMGIGGVSGDAPPASPSGGAGGSLARTDAGSDNAAGSGGTAGPGGGADAVSQDDAGAEDSGSGGDGSLEDDGPAGPGDEVGPSPAPSSYECSQFMGPNITANWFKAGFEPAGDQAWNDAWQVKAPHASFANLWANPGHEVWNAPVQSPCPAGRKLERVVFVTQLLDWTSNDVGKWKSAIEGGIKTIRAKYPAVKRIDLVTFYRSIDNKPCSKPKESWVPAAHDEAHKQIAAESGGSVVVGPMVRVECGQFTSPPYLTPAGERFVAEKYLTHYRQGP